ncbi:MAG: serine/threonine-protein kinase [Phycisphaerales bacterium]
MIADRFFLFDFEELYRDGDPPFREILAKFPPQSDADLAELIEVDGRIRIRLNRPVDLARYLHASPGLPDRVEALDAAIDMALRWLAKTGRPDNDAVESLARDYPHLDDAIREAAELSNAICSTTRLRGEFQNDAPPAIELPSDFGPNTPDGEPRYELRSLLGEGAFGQVFLAIDRQLSEADHAALVAIKVLSGARRGAWDRRRIIEEATKARRIEHPNVVRVIDRGVSDRDDDFIVYEFVSGGNLARWLRRQPERLSVRQSVALMSKIARGVHAAHMAGLVHCDLKPQNILLTSKGEPRVADFGIAVRLDGDRESGADDQPAQGNLAFISPEQFRGEEGALNVPSDLYALGGILYWLLSNRLPNGSSADEIRRTHDLETGRREPPAPSVHRGEVDGDLDAICRRAMARRPVDRYGSAAEFANDLDAWLRREPIAWTNPTVRRRVSLWRRRNPVAAAALVLAVLIGATGFGVSRRYAAIAEAREYERWLAESRANEEAIGREKFEEFRANWLARMGATYRDGVTTEILPQMWGMEWLYGPTALGGAQDASELWKHRAEVVRGLLELNRANGGDEHAFSLLWETCLGFWLVVSGDSIEAEPLLLSNREKWRRRLEPDDPFLADLQTLVVAARVNRFLAESKEGATVSPGELLDALEWLEQDAARPRAGETRSPLQTLASERTAILYGPHLLDDFDSFCITMAIILGEHESWQSSRRIFVEAAEEWAPRFRADHPRLIALRAIDAAFAANENSRRTMLNEQTFPEDIRLASDRLDAAYRSTAAPMNHPEFQTLVARQSAVINNPSLLRNIVAFEDRMATWLSQPGERRRAIRMIRLHNGDWAEHFDGADDPRHAIVNTLDAIYQGVLDSDRSPDRPILRERAVALEAALERDASHPYPLPDPARAVVIDLLMHYYGPERLDDATRRAELQAMRNPTAQVAPASIPNQ